MTAWLPWALLAAGITALTWRSARAVLAHVKPPAPAATPPRAPGKTPHDPRTTIPKHATGGLEYAVKVWRCGCILLFDGHGRITGTTPCGHQDDLDRELRNLTDGQH